MSTSEWINDKLNNIGGYLMDTVPGARDVIASANPSKRVAIVLDDTPPIKYHVVNFSKRHKPMTKSSNVAFDITVVEGKIKCEKPKRTPFKGRVKYGKWLLRDIVIADEIVVNIKYARLGVTIKFNNAKILPLKYEIEINDGVIDPILLLNNSLINAENHCFQRLMDRKLYSPGLMSLGAGLECVMEGIVEKDAEKVETIRLYPRKPHENHGNKLFHERSFIGSWLQLNRNVRWFNDRIVPLFTVDGYPGYIGIDKRTHKKLYSLLVSMMSKFPYISDEKIEIAIKPGIKLENPKSKASIIVYLQCNLFDVPTEIDEIQHVKIIQEELM